MANVQARNSARPWPFANAIIRGRAAASQQPRQSARPLATRNLHTQRTVSTATPSQATPGLECLACTETTTPGASIVTGCHHRICNPCIQRRFEAAISDQTSFPARCCPVEQEGKILLESVRHILSADLARRYEAKAREYTTQNATYCHRPRCFTFIPAPAGGYGKTARCPQCRVETCVQCKKASHAGRECPADPNQQALEQLADQQGWRHCPRCNVIVELTIGCNQMT